MTRRLCSVLTGAGPLTNVPRDGTASVRPRRWSAASAADGPRLTPRSRTSRASDGSRLPAGYSPRSIAVASLSAIRRWIGMCPDDSRSSVATVRPLEI